MAKEVKLAQVGLGWVGSQVVTQLLAYRPWWQQALGITVKVIALVRRQGGILRFSGLTDDELQRALLAKRLNKPIPLEPNSIPVLAAQELVARLVPEEDSLVVLLDATGAEELGPVLVSALRKGIHVVTANKKPLAASSAVYHQLLAASREGRAALLYETTVGAGLPILRTLRALLQTGDEIHEIQGCLSGTNNFLCACLEQGESLTEAVRRAQELGYTEPDPREDVAGWDAARKALILSRTLGRCLDLEEVEIRGFVPPERGPYIPERFYHQLHQLEAPLAEQVAAARRQQRVPRFLVTITPQACRVGLEFVPSQTPLGQLRGPENLIVFRTKRYDQYPLIVQGPGAGPEVTAAGVLRDLLSIAGAHDDRLQEGRSLL